MRSSIKVNTNKDLLLLRNNILGMKMVLSVYFQSVLNLETHTVIFVNEKLLPLKFASKYLEGKKESGAMDIAGRIRLTIS